MSLRKLLIAAGVAYAGLAIPAMAADVPADAPKPCGPILEDKAGDSASGDKEADLIGAWFSQQDGKVSVNFHLSEASESYSGPGIEFGVDYFMLFKVGSAMKYVGYENDFIFGESIGGGTWDDGSTSEFEESSGKVYPGPNGVISVQVPASMAKEGAVFGAPQAIVRTYLGEVLIITTDEDQTAKGTEFTVGQACASETGGGGATTGDVVIKIGKSAGSAKAANKKKQAKISVTTSEELTNVTVTLKKGSSTIGTGKAATLTGTKKVALKLAKKVKKGSYAVEVSGTTKSGAAGTAKGKVSFKK